MSTIPRFYRRGYKLLGRGAWWQCHDAPGRPLRWFDRYGCVYFGRSRNQLTSCAPMRINNMMDLALSQAVYYPSSGVKLGYADRAHPSLALYPQVLVRRI